MSEKRKKTLTVKPLADSICKDNHFAQDAGGKLDRYVDGAYRRRAEEYVKGQVKRICVNRGMAGAWNSHLANEVVEFIRVDAPELWERPPMDLINVRNGLLRVEDRTLQPHSPDHRSSVQLPVAFDPEADCVEIAKFVEQVFPSDAISLAYEICGCLMRPDTSIQKSVLFTGAGGEGKSTFCNVVVRFLGKSNTSALSLHRLESDKFAVARLVGKLANVCPDLPSEHLAGTSVFKALTGGDELTAEHKFKDSFEFTPFCRLVFSANHPPRSSDSSHAFFRRWIVVPFDRPIPPEEQIPRPVLDARLTSDNELSGLLNRALDALPDLKSRGGFSEPESVRRAWDDFHASTDPLSVWLDQNTVEDPDAVVSKDSLRAAYNAEANQHGRPGLGQTHFGRALRKLRPALGDGQRTLNGRRVRCYVGLGLVQSGNGQPTNGDPQTTLFE